MARKTKIIKDELKGRDAGKVFLITELDAWEAEAWATEALFSLTQCLYARPCGSFR